MKKVGTGACLRLRVVVESGLQSEIGEFVLSQDQDRGGHSGLLWNIHATLAHLSQASVAKYKSKVRRALFKARSFPHEFPCRATTLSFIRENAVNRK